MIQVENKLDVLVEEIMTKQVHTVDVSDQMMHVRKMMANKHIRHAPVLKKGNLVGILSLTDVQRMTFSSTFGEDEAEVDEVISDMFNAEMIMHKDPETVEYNSTIREAAQKFSERSFHALPVVQDGVLVGIITTTDILKYIVK